jgi:formate hydrogenlyase transcriptional activator
LPNDITGPRSRSDYYSRLFVWQPEMLREYLRRRHSLLDMSASKSKPTVDLQQIVDVIPQTITVLAPDGTIIYANQAVLDYTGLTIDDVMKSDFRDRVFHPEDVKRLRDERQQAMARGEPFENEQRARGKDGKYRWFLIRYKPLLDETGNALRWYASGTDIDDLKRAEAKLRHDERELRQLVDSLPQHVLVLDAQGSILQVNRMMLDYLGRTLKEMQNPATDDRIKRDLHPDDLERVQTERSIGLSRGVPFEIEKRSAGKDGQFRWFLFRYKPLLDEKGRIAKWFVTATDIEDRKQAEERMRNETFALREEIDRTSMSEEIVGSSRPLRRVLAQVEKVAPTDSTVLIFGETGTGKELIARSIHKRSKRSQRAFIAVNCAAIPASLIASELFGHEKGAFTGAAQRRLGRFESADGGTIFLDEVGELPLETQIALLRVLQDKKIERVGSSKSISVDIRVLAATNRDLSAAIAAGTFRQDLFYRLNVVPIEIPSLRERKDDIPLLVEYLIDRYAQKTGKKIIRMERKTLELFETYGWPGNIRELQNVVERAVILSDGDIFSVDETWFRTRPQKLTGPTVPFADDLSQRERELIESALQESKGKTSGPSGAATRLGIPRQTLESRIKALGIDKYSFKNR